jgi:hypothetical protein
VAVVEGIVLEDHEVRDEEGTLQLRMVYIAEFDAAQREETLLELGMEVRGDDAGRGETAEDGGRVKFATEYAAVEVGVVGRMKETVKETACEHEGKEGTRRRRRRFVVQGEDDAVFHGVLKEEERGGHVEEEETRKGKHAKKEGARI